MKIAYMSDLHLEIADLDITNPDTDVLVLAGDICTLRHLDSNGKLGNRYRQFFKRCTDQWRHVLYVLGNHESYGYRVEKSQARAREIPGVVFLDNTTVEINGVKFWGATLWTDLSNPMDSIAAQMSMNDYKTIRTEGGVRPISPQDTTRWHKESLKSLQDSGAQVVITHHAPSWMSISDVFKGDTINPAYASHLDNVILSLAPSIWIHGHVHSRNCYQIGSTCVLSNPRGYSGFEHIADTFKVETVDIG